MSDEQIDELIGECIVDAEAIEDFWRAIALAARKDIAKKGASEFEEFIVDGMEASFFAGARRAAMVLGKRMLRRIADRADRQAQQN